MSLAVTTGGIAIFARVSSRPQPDRSLRRGIGPGSARPDGKFGVAAGYAHMRSFEGLLTVVYQYQSRDGSMVRPNFQYIINPGGGATVPSGPLPGKALKNASAFGLRRPSTSKTLIP